MCQNHYLKNLLDENKTWAESVKKTNPSFFKTLSQEQHPKLLWIGCSDSRVPASQVTNLKPGDIFVHRNIANLVLHSDMNCQSVIQYAVEALKVNHIIVCGHHGCGGIKAAMHTADLGLIDNWLRNIKDIYNLHTDEISSIPDESDKVNRLSELNVKAQVRHVAENPFVQKQWDLGRNLSVHGLIYSLKTGLLKDLNISANGKMTEKKAEKE